MKYSNVFGDWKQGHQFKSAELPPPQTSVPVLHTTAQSFLVLPLLHALQSKAAYLTNCPSGFYIKLLWSKGDRTWHLVRKLSKITNDARIPVLGSLIAKVGRAFEFGTQPDPQSCDVLSAFSSLTALAMDALLTVSPWASITPLNFYFPYPCSFVC